MIQKNMSSMMSRKSNTKELLKPLQVKMKSLENDLHIKATQI